MYLSIPESAPTEVPEGAFAGDEPLVVVERGGYPASVHRGTLAAVDPDGQPVFSVGDPDQPAFLRSAAKPFQAMPAVLSGAVKRYGIDERELAVLCASHSGEPRHQAAVLSVLAKAGVSEAALRCGVHDPLHEETARLRWRRGLEPTPVCNNCSGAHAGMLLACRAQDWPLDTYTQPDHPLQRMIRETLAAFAGMRADQIQVGVDNCAVPTFRLPLRSAAQAFARLVTGRGLTPRLAEVAAQVVAAMTASPEMVGGEGRFDTDLMRAGRGAILAKGGADGFQAVGLAAAGVGLAIKISDGSSRAVPPATLHALLHLGALDEFQRTALQTYVAPEVLNLQNERVGRIVPAFHPVR